MVALFHEPKLNVSPENKGLCGIKPEENLICQRHIVWVFI